MKLVDLLELISTLFNKEEVRALCFELDVDYEDLGGEGKRNKVRELIIELRDRRRLPELVDAIAAARAGFPGIDWTSIRQEVVSIQEAYRVPARQPDDPFAEVKLSPPFQVPPRVPYFIGREFCLAQLRTYLTQPESRSNPIVGLFGAGGVGKTALAIQPSRELLDAFPDGILWARLDTSTPEAELISFAAAYGQADAVAQLPDLSNKAVFVRDILANKKCLVVLDQAQDSDQVEWLLPSGKENVTLITTRNGKMLSSLEAASIPIEEMSVEEGLAYLKNAIGQERVEAEAAAAANVVRQVGALPLALSVVAGYLAEADDLTLAEYDQLLQDENTRLENLADWEDSNRDVAASFELSYQSLPANFQHLFATLAVFEGPDFSAEAVSAVASIPLARAKMGLGRLYFLSLLSGGLGERDTLFPIQTDGSGRYRLSPLLRLFARQKLADEIEPLRRRAADYYAGLAQQYKGLDGYDRLDLDWLNILAVLRRAYEQQQWEPLVQGVLALTQSYLGTVGFLDARGYWAEANQLLAWAQKSPQMTEDPWLRATLLWRQGAFAWRQAETETAEEMLRESLDLLRTLPAEEEILFDRACVCQLMAELMMTRDPQEALDWCQSGLTTLQGLDSARATHEAGYLYVRQAAIWGMTGKLAEACQAAQRGIQQLPEAASPARVSGYMNLGIIHYYQGQPDQALASWQAGIRDAQALGDYRRLAGLWLNMANLESFHGRFQQAAEARQKALAIYCWMGDAEGESFVGSNLSRDYAVTGEEAAALSQVEAAVELAQTRQLPRAEMIALATRAWLQLYLEQGSSAPADLGRALEICRQLELVEFQAEILRLQAELALRGGQYGAAASLIDASIETALDETEAGVSQRLKGHIFRAQGQDDAATAAYRQSLEELQGQEPFELARTQLALGGHLQASGRAAEAQALLADALHTFQSLGTKREITAAMTLLAEFTELPPQPT